jgi:hypothetical protein
MPPKERRNNNLGFLMNIFGQLLKEMVVQFQPKAVRMHPHKIRGQYIGTFLKLCYSLSEQASVMGQYKS